VQGKSNKVSAEKQEYWCNWVQLTSPEHANPTQQYTVPHTRVDTDT